MEAGFQHGGHFNEFIQLGPKSSDRIPIRRRGRNGLLPNALFYRKNIVLQLHEFRASGIPAGRSSNEYISFETISVSPPTARANSSVGSKMGGRISPNP